MLLLGSVCREVQDVEDVFLRVYEGACVHMYVLL